MKLGETGFLIKMCKTFRTFSTERFLVVALLFGKYLPLGTKLSKYFFSFLTVFKQNKTKWKSKLLKTRKNNGRASYFQNIKILVT